LSPDKIELPVINLRDLVEGRRNSGVISQAEQAAHEMHRRGLVVVYDPRFSIEGRSDFFAMLQAYYAQDPEVIARDVRRYPDRVVGVAMMHTEKGRNHSARIADYPEHHRPYTTADDCERGDPKYRWHHRAIHPNVRAELAGTPALQAMLDDQLVPVGFEDRWRRIMDQRSTLLIQTIFDASRLVAIGLGLPEDVFVETMQHGTNLFAPTGSDLSTFQPDDVMASFHYDFGQWTGHDSASHGGLIAWTRDGKPIRVEVPHGCVLIQAGKEAEILTGGYIQAGFHEVIATDEAIAQARTDKAEGRSPIRIAGPLFAQSGPGVVLSPRGRFATDERLGAYPPILSERHQADEIAANNLGDNP
jgi:isopenicillin N synthase-like dioxygenase